MPKIAPWKIAPNPNPNPNPNPGETFIFIIMIIIFGREQSFFFGGRAIFLSTWKVQSNEKRLCFR